MITNRIKTAIALFLGYAFGWDRSTCVLIFAPKKGSKRMDIRFFSD